MVAFAAAAGIAPAGAGADARLDKSFGKAGYVTTSAKGKTLVGYGVAVVGNRVVLAGQVDTKSGDGQVIVARYRSNGRLDRDFAKRGVFESSLPKKDGPFLATAVTPAGSAGLFVAGGYGQGSMLALRLTKRGRLDRSFGKQGIATARVGGTAGSIAVQEDGAILLGGSNANANGRPMVVARMTPAGKLDPTFGDGGIAETLFWDPNMAASAGAAGVAPTAEGGVVAFGHLDYIGGDGHGSAGVFELTSDGQPDAGFGTGGGVEVAFANPAGGFAQWFPCGFGIDSQDRITITGDGSMGASDGILTTRVTAQGVPDPAFGEVRRRPRLRPGRRQRQRHDLRGHGRRDGHDDDRRRLDARPAHPRGRALHELRARRSPGRQEAQGRRHQRRRGGGQRPRHRRRRGEVGPLRRPLPPALRPEIRSARAQR